MTTTAGAAPAAFAGAGPGDRDGEGLSAALIVFEGIRGFRKRVLG